jgi:hypothetical protein
MSSWKKIAEFGDEIKAELINAAFHNAGITTTVLDKKDSAYVVLGVIEIYVPEEQFEKARSIFQDITEEEE